MRELSITEEMKAAITRVNDGNPVDFEKIAVFEAKSLNTRPLRRKSGIFQHAETRKNMLDGMVEFLNNGNEGVPLHEMHDTNMLNVGKLFQAREDQMPDGAWQLSTLFYVPREDASLVARLNTGAVDQVSVGVLAEHILCSECNFDYRTGPIDNLMMLECDKGHVIGENGVHTILDGLDSWGEMSIVNSGAAQDARIVSSSQSKFVPRDTTAWRLAAGHNQNEQGTSIPLIANLNEISGEENTEVNKDEMKAVVEAALAAHETAHTAALDALQTKLTEAETARDNAVTKATDAEAKLAEAETAQATITGERDAARTERDGVKAELTEASAFLIEQATKAQIAAGSKAPTTAATFKEAITTITESGANLVNLFARDQTINPKTASASSFGLSAFKRNGE